MHAHSTAQGIPFWNSRLDQPSEKEQVLPTSPGHSTCSPSQQVLPTMFSALMHLEGSDEELIMMKLKQELITQNYSRT